MKKMVVIFLSTWFIFAFGPELALSTKESEHPPVVLMDRNGNEISMDSNVSYSPKTTCGECHDYDLITNAYHFQQGRTDADGNIIVHDGLDSKNPWLISRGMYGKW
jgi:hypothetical protein